MMQGRELYNNECSSCHASDAKSGFLDIRNSRVADINYALEEEPLMVELGIADQVSPAEVELISLYLIEIYNDPDVEFGNQCDKDPILIKANLGNRLFFDSNLSLNRTMSCATCHDPSHAFVDARFKDTGTTNTVHGALSVGDDGVTLGGRNAPTAAYAKFTPTFAINTKGEYSGGQFHDGRAATLQDQAKGPFLDPAEMMMPSPESVIDRVMENPQYVTDFKAIYGDTIFNNKVTAYDALAESIAEFEKSDIFSPFDSKYDRSKLDPGDPDHYSMNALEQQGYEIFFNTSRTNCAFCHSINSATEGSNEIFSNFEYENIGTPKNLKALIARDGDTSKTDLQLGGRVDIDDPTLYGLTKVPTLRNIAVTDPYMSNGVFKELRTIFAFYNHMSGNNSTPLNPETNAPWDDAEVSTTVNLPLLQMEPLTEVEMDALEAFLKTLTGKRYEGLLE
jgi:cytochrome c peroxidase